jgi:hypothetical protein
MTTINVVRWSTYNIRRFGYQPTASRMIVSIYHSSRQMSVGSRIRGFQKF